MASLPEKLLERGINLKDFIETKTKEGLYPDDIGKLLNVHKTTIRNYARKYQVRVKDKPLTNAKWRSFSINPKKDVKWHGN